MAKGAATGEGPPQNRQQIIERGPQPTTVAAARADIEIPVAQTAQPPATNALEQGRKAQADPTDHKDAFEKERQRSDALSLELALARQEIEARRAAADAADVAAKMAQAAVSNNREAVEKERRRGDDLDRDLATAREEVEALQARVAAALAARHDAEHAMQTAQASAAEQKHAHERERERAAALARELASGREKVEALQARLAGALARVETARAAQAAGAPAEAAGYVAAASTEAIGSPEMRVDNKLVADQQPAAAPRASVGRDDSVAGPADEPQAATLAGLAKPAARPPRAAEEIALWLKRGEDFVAVGDFASARLLFRRAAESGDADAALMLAATYDPSVFDRFQVKGLAANLAEAQSWYQKAKDLGSAEAPRRLELLVQMRR